jgi:acyl-coenzyme A synthetase/AMP-(fatty) acid ligase
MRSLYGVPDSANNQIMVIDSSGGTISYEEFDKISRQLLLHIKPRSLIAVLASNTIGSLVAIAALINNKLPIILLDSSVDFTKVKPILETYQPAYVALPRQLLAQMNNQLEEAQFFDYVLVPYSATEYGMIHQDLALLLTTSGSTGSNKFVRLTYENLRSNGSAIIEYLQLDSNERPVTTLPMHYSYGFSIINSHLMAGATILVTGRSMVEKDFWEFVNANKASSFGGVPYTFEMLNRIKFQKIDVPTIRTITQAGGKLADSKIVEFNQHCIRKKIKFITMYGQTEASPRISFLENVLTETKLGSIGKAIPGGKLYLIDSNGNEIYEPKTSGELVYEGKNVSMGYATSRGDLSSGDLNKGKLLTGDMAYFDEDDFFYITGRKNRFIKVLGNRISLDELEQIVIPISADSVCVERDNLVTICVIDPSVVDMVKQKVANSLDLHQRMIDVVVISRIPRSSTGKVIYSELLEELNEV